MIVEDIRPVKEKVTVNWYNPFYGYITNIRTAIIVRKHPLEEILQVLKDPKLRIYTVVDNEPLITAADEARMRSGDVSRAHIIQRQRVKEGGEWYIDEFGLHVYIQSYIGYREDFDMRYNSIVNREPELLTLTPYNV